MSNPFTEEWLAARYEKLKQPPPANEARPVVAPKAKGRIPETEYANNTERAYAQHLDLRLKAGDIAWWEYGCIKIRLADRTWLSPDFLVMNCDGTLELHDTKGGKRVTRKNGRVDQIGYTEEDAQIKLKVVGERFVIPIYKVWKLANGEWARREM